MTSLAVLILLLEIGVTAATFYPFTGTLGGYACAQPVLYYQCGCPTFCSAYGGVNGYGYGGSYYGSSYPNGYTRRRHRKKKKKKFRFETLEEIEEPPELPRTTTKPKSSTRSWEDEDLWEKKFVSPKTEEPEDEEFPEITSAEIAAAKARKKGRGEESEATSGTERETSGLRTTSGSSNGGGRGGGLGAGNGAGLGGIGVSTGLGVGAPGIGGLGGGGGLFGISSGIGVGVPGIGPIGVSSGLGIGR